jgi:hypothetical protein
MITKLDFPKGLVNLVSKIKRGTTHRTVLAAFIVARLKANHGNRTWTYREIKMPSRTFRDQLNFMKAMGYDIPEFDRKKHYALMKDARMGRAKNG